MRRKANILDGQTVPHPCKIAAAMQKWRVDPLLLRTATRPEHESAESVMPLMSAELTREQYVQTLTRLYGVVAGWEIFRNRHAPAALQPLLDGRNRTAWIAGDLAFFQIATPISVAQIRDIETDAHFLGAMYVMEGSTLGGQHIARHVAETLHLTNGTGNAYFFGAGDHTGPMWKQFRAIIEAEDDANAHHVISGARTMFRIFEEWMRTDK